MGALPRVLLVESGPRHLLEGFLPFLRHTCGNDALFDLVTCFPGLPTGVAPGTTWRVSDYRDGSLRRSLVRQLRARGYSVTVIICAGVPIMTRWKWILAFLLPAKVLVLNENGDCFWLDWAHRRTVRHFVLFRTGLSGANAVRTIGRFVLFPLTLAYLLLYAGTIHLRRLMR